MQTSARLQNHFWYELVVLSILILFGFQLLVDFVEGIYAFGLLGTGIPNEIIAVLLFLAPFVLLFLPGGITNRGIIGLGYIMCLTRVLEVLLDTRLRMIVSGVGTACFLVLLPSLILYYRFDEDKRTGIRFALSTSAALVLIILGRLVESGLDSSTDGWLTWLGWVLALVCVILLPLAFRRKLDEAGNTAKTKPRSSFLRSTGLSLGLAGAVILLYFAFIAPNVIVRWTESSYPLAVSVMMLALIVFVLVLGLKPGLLLTINRWLLIAWNAVFVFALVVTISMNQEGFPPTPGDFPVFATPNPTWALLPVLILLITFPVIILNLVHLFNELTATMPSSRSLGGSFGIASIFIMFMVLAHVFTTTYDYIPVIGPLFRDKFWLVYLVPGLTMLFSILLVKTGENHQSTSNKEFPIFSSAIILLSFVGIALVFLHTSSPQAVSSSSPEVKIITYNIQQGYSDAGLKNFTGQLEIIQEINADIIGLQESDTNRIANGNTDIVRYFADSLNMYSYFGPKTVTGTFGIALLSRFPIENPRTFYMYSEGEQTAAIQARITIGETTYNLYVTHLGNGGPIIQQEQILEVIDGQENVILIGDFNFRPDTPQYKMTTTLLDDAWLTRWPAGDPSQGIDPLDRIDHTFISPGIKVTDSRYIPDPASDHPLMWTTIHVNDAQD